MVWINENNFNIFRNYISKHQRSNKTLRYKLIENIRRYRASRIYVFNIGNVNFLLKQEDLSTKKDNIKHEYNVGLVINNMRNIIPNFVSTLGIVKGNIASNNILPCSRKVPSDLNVNF